MFIHHFCLAADLFLDNCYFKSRGIGLDSDNSVTIEKLFFLVIDSIQVAETAANLL